MSTPQGPSATAATCGCPQFDAGQLRLSRRRFLGATGAATGVLTVGSLFGEAFRSLRGG